MQSADDELLDQRRRTGATTSAGHASTHPERGVVETLRCAQTQLRVRSLDRAERRLTYSAPYPAAAIRGLRYFRARLQFGPDNARKHRNGERAACGSCPCAPWPDGRARRAILAGRP